jgi:hypothetical protein
MSNLSELLPAGAGAKSADFVASGTLSSGQLVSLKADGTVEAASVSYTDFIGITDEAISSAASGSVVVQGGVSTSVTGLTIGTDYYVQSDGTLNTTVTTIPAGRALSATSILLEG